MNDLTQRGIQALKSGDRSAARKLLSGAVKEDPNDAAAWLWLTGALDNDEERAACLRQVLRIEPTNQAAARGLSQIIERAKAARIVPATQEVPATQDVLAAKETQAVSETPPVVEVQAAPEHQLEPLEDEPSQAQPLTFESFVGTEPAADEQMTAFEETQEHLPEAEFEPIPVDRLSAVVQESAPRPGAPTPVPPAVETAVQPPSPVVKPPAASTEAPRLIFRTRPSLVPSLACFWIFLIGAMVLAILLNQAPTQALIMVGAVALLLELVVLYAILRTFAARYELTSQQVTLRFRGKRVRVNIRDIVGVECRQSAMQKMVGIGDIELDAAVNGELARLRMHNVSQCQKRAEQIQYLVRDQRQPA